MDLEKEIEKAEERIREKKEVIETEVADLESKITTFTKWAWTFVTVGLVVTVFGIIVYLCTNTEQGYGLNLLGDFMAGTVASFWSLAGLFFIYVAFLGQKQQLLNQQLELMYSQLEVKYTRLELAGQKEELKEQNKTLRRQRFENTFFQLLQNHQDIVNGLDIQRRRNSEYQTIAQGRDCFSNFYQSLSARLKTVIEFNKMEEIYIEFYNEKQSDLGHYFRNLYHILKFVNEAPELLDGERTKYTNLLRALLSSHELVLLFYNGLGRFGRDKLKPLLEQFSMLKNMDRSLVFQSEHLNKYDELAFASSEERAQLLNKTKE